MAEDIEICSVFDANGQELPIHGNTLGSNWSQSVKEERVDEAEILEMAAKMVEMQKAALIKQQFAAQAAVSRQAVITNGMQQPIPPATNGQTNIMNYLSRQKYPTPPNGTTPFTNGRTVHNGATMNGTDTSSSSSSDKKTPCDEESQKGHFGWTTFGKIYIPYIYRQQEKYCSVRMIELKLLTKYLNCLHPDIYSSCTCVRSYYITEAEARLLIEINHKHCDGEFGRDIFTQKDLVVRLSDATKFYQFLDICYRKLISGSKSPSEKCGFIRINKESVVPYTVRNNEQVVPLFYFEGETENLKQKADYLSGWDLAYLKFCCKVQGIRNELFSSENVAVISLTDIKSYFPNGTEFEDYWPSKVVDSNLLIGNRTNTNNSVNWTRQPTQPPPKVMSQSQLSQKSSHASNVTAAQQQQQQMLRRGGGSANAFAAAQSAAAMQQSGQQRMHSNSALTQATVQALTNGLTNGSWMSQSQSNLPLIHAQMLASQAQQSHANSRSQYRNPMENLILGNRQQYTYNNNAISMQPVSNHGQSNAPPPLVRASGQSANHMSIIEQAMLPHQLHQQQQRISNSAPMASTSTATATNQCDTTNPYYKMQNSLNASNLAFWNQLTPSQRLLLTQQIKNNSYLGNSNPYVTDFPSLPLDTDLINMLNYAKSNTNNNNIKNSDASSSKSNGHFQKPLVPPLLSNNRNNNNNNNALLESQSKNGVNKTSKPQQSYSTQQMTSPQLPLAPSSPTMNSESPMSTVPLNSFIFEKYFKMDEEMKAVVQKVLLNPDLSTFIQTNSSNSFVPIISPPISPLTSGNINTHSNVTITPQISTRNFSQPNNLGGASLPISPPMSSSSSRQRSVICCSTNSGSLSVPPSPSTSNSTSTPSPSPNCYHPLLNVKNSGAAGTGDQCHNLNHQNSQCKDYNYQQLQQKQQQHYQFQQDTPSMEVIDLSSPRRSLQAATAYLQQQQQAQQVHQAVAAAHQQQRLTAAAHQHSQQNGRTTTSAVAAAAAAAAANSASLHLQRHAALAASAAAAAVDNAQRLSVIPEIPANNLNLQPYKMQKVYVDAHIVPCINMKAYNDSDQLMTLTDFQKYFFSSVPLEHCKRLIEALGVELYKGNRRQNQILMEYDRNHNENIPLVQVRDIMKYMTQLTFMIRNQEQPPSKRSRLS